MATDALSRTQSMAKPPRSYWVVSGLALVWMLIGVLAWIADLMMNAALADWTEAQRQLYEMRPQWLFWVYAIAVFSGLFGAIALLLRKAWSIPLFVLSLVAIIVQFGYTFLVMKAAELLGAGAAAFPLLIFAIGVFLLWFALRAKRAGWIQT